jgi:hypothetical protein
VPYRDLFAVLRSGKAIVTAHTLGGTLSLYEEVSPSLELLRSFEDLLTAATNPKNHRERETKKNFIIFS